MVKKIALILSVILIFSCLCGCDLFDESDAEFTDVKPNNSDPTNPIVDPNDGDPGAPAEHLEGAVVNGVYSCGEYSFTVPNEWRGAIECIAEQVASGAYTVTRRSFYYVQSDEVKVVMLQIDSVPIQIYRNATYKRLTVLATAADGTKAYIILKQSGSLPGSFTDYETYTSIYEYINGGSFKLSAVA